MNKKKWDWIDFIPVFIFGFLSLGCENDDPTGGNPMDIDGNEYHTVIIGTQEWMVDNLRMPHYCNGDPILHVMDTAIWKNLSSGAYCSYDNDPSFSDTFGHLYNWYAVSDLRQIAPESWHVPTLEEWTVLENYLGGDTLAGGKLKESGTEYWREPNVGATNESGFSALPGGYRAKFGRFYLLGEYGYWWTASEGESGTDFAWHRHLSYSYKMVGGCDCGKGDGYSIRCIRD
jgi:uncharacterized protein (TIGR02145 family)